MNVHVKKLGCRQRAYQLHTTHPILIAGPATRWSGRIPSGRTHTYTYIHSQKSDMYTSRPRLPSTYTWSVSSTRTQITSTHIVIRLKSWNSILVVLEVECHISLGVLWKSKDMSTFSESLNGESQQCCDVTENKHQF